ncbi:hypothetical protein EMCRGX_G003992 [Ephydatia muelleri]
MALTLAQRGRGCALGHMVGDALGAAFEGLGQSDVRSLARFTWGSDLVQDHLLAVPMGTFTAGDEPGVYRSASRVSDANFVPTGPPRTENTAKHCARIGMYTDDTNSCLALGSSILECGRVDALHAARQYAVFFRDNEAYRGCPPSAKAVMKAVLDVMRRAVTDAIVSSHRHPEAVDFAVLQAMTVQYALTLPSAADFSAPTLLARLADCCETEEMRQMVTSVAAALTSALEVGPIDERGLVGKLVRAVHRPGSGMGFQIASIHMAPCVLWTACRHHASPRLAVQTAIDLGGDTDTTAALVGAIMGALHGEEWCADWAAGMENGPHGRDYAVRLAEQLLQLDVRD